MPSNLAPSMVSTPSSEAPSSSSSRGVRFATPRTDDDFRTELAATPMVNRDVRYMQPQERAVDSVAPPSTISRPNHEDILRRVSVVIHQHIKKCEDRLLDAAPEDLESGKFHLSKGEEFSEENYVSPQYVYHFVRVPVTRLGFTFGIRKLKKQYTLPDLNDVHEFISTLFVKAQLSSECSIVCLIYVERLMEQAHVPINGKTWRPLLLCGLLLASKVWQDLPSWNVEVAEIYPEFPLAQINRLERTFCQHMQWELYISQSLYAKYYFALRSLTARKDFRKKYNVMMTEAPKAVEISKRTDQLKEDFLSSTEYLSRSL